MCEHPELPELLSMCEEPVFSACQNCLHPFDFEWADLGLHYACPKCHFIHEQVMLEIHENLIYTLLGPITPHVRTWMPEIKWVEGQLVEIPFERPLH